MLLNSLGGSTLLQGAGEIEMCLALLLAVQLSCNVFVSISVVTLRWARLVPGWVTVFGRVNYLGCNQPVWSTQNGHPSVGRRYEYQLRLGR